MKKTYIKQSISSELAEKMIEQAKKKSLEINKPMVIAIVDESGLLKAFTKMDGAALISIEIAQNKAYSAVANAWGHATHEIYEHIKKKPETLAGIPQIPKYIIFGGGFPIKITNEIVGAIGISGGNVDQDMDVAKSVLSILQNTKL